jgi:anti-sigma regulatory factor (Ser/Thr protein kinase)
MPHRTHDPARCGHEHLVHFYETEDDLARTVVSHLQEAIANGALVVVIATEPHRLAFAAGLRRAGCDLDDGYRALDAAQTLALLMPHGRLDWAAFDEVIGGAIRDAAGTGRQVVAYGEMVALLWEAGDVPGAIELETFWNELAEELPFSLLCAYRSAAVSSPEHARALDKVCQLHTRSLSTAARKFAPTPTAPAAARQFVVQTLRKWGRGSVIDATLVISELATNAVVHAHSPFTVVARSDGENLRLEVTDSSRRQPRESAQPPDAPSGRGLHVVARIARAWGVEDTPQGKTVWAELSSRCLTA